MTNSGATAKLIGPFPKLPPAQQEPLDATPVLAALFESLHEIDVAFKLESDEPPATLQAEQARIVEALAAVGRLLLKLRSPHADRFFDLSDAFADAAGGAHPPIFRFPKKRTVPNATKLEAARASVAFAVEVFMALGAKPKDAATRALRECPDIKKLAGPKSYRSENELWETVLEWRKTLSSPSRKKNALAAEIFETGRDLIVFFIKEGRQTELEARALGRLRYAERVAQSVLVRRSNPDT
jgi:hypothetical protein